jgi:hypothetical protein
MGDRHQKINENQSIINQPHTNHRSIQEVNKINPGSFAGQVCSGAASELISFVLIKRN